MALGMKRLQFLHISDLHAKGQGEREPWRRRRVLGDAWKLNLETLLAEEGPVQFVLFTGDAAHSGRTDEYAEVTDFLHALCKELAIDLDRVYVIPGNHDLARDTQTNIWQQMRMRLAATPDLLAVSRWMNGVSSTPPAEFDNSWRTDILERQNAYRRWVTETLKRPELAPSGLGYRHSVTLPGWTHPIHIVGLDTSWLCGDDADSGHLLLTENQIATHLTDASGHPLHGTRIVMMHHPVDELADARSARRMLADHADLVLRGHLHQTELADWVSPDRRLRSIAVGSLYEGGLADTWGNSCQFVRLELDAEGRPIDATVRFRSFSPEGGHWFDDNSKYRDSSDGRIVWTFGPNRLSRKPNPFSPWTPRGEYCFGREALFRRLEAAFDERRGMWLVGDWRIGKSTILLAWENVLRDRGVTVRLISGQGAAGVSVSRFVESVTGLDAPPDSDGAADRLADWTAAVARAGLPPVILVDEVESIVRSCDERFFERLREQIGSICLVFVSREEPDLVFSRASKTSPITNRMERAWVGLMEEEGRDKTIQLGAEHLGPGDADLMTEWCGEHPFFLHLLGRYLVEARLAGAHPSQGLNEFKLQSPIYFRQLWQTLPSSQRSALHDAARGVPAHSDLLQQRGFVTPDGAPFGEIFAAWLRGEIGT